MTEKKAQYSTKPPVTMQAFNSRPCTLPYSDPKYEAPTVEEVRALISLAGWSQVETAILAGVSYNRLKGSTTVRRWRTDENKSDHRPIPYSAWRLLLLAADIVSIDSDIESLNNHGPITKLNSSANDG